MYKPLCTLELLAFCHYGNTSSEPPSGALFYRFYLFSSFYRFSSIIVVGSSQDPGAVFSRICDFLSYKFYRIR